MSTTYTTKQGDTWDGVAYSQLGSTSYTHLLLWENLEHIRVHSFGSGVVLSLPEIPTSGFSVLPPWKEVVS